jgi:hypothetical protein
MCCRTWLIIKTERKKEPTLKVYFIGAVLFVFIVLIYECLHETVRSVNFLCITGSEQNSRSNCPETHINHLKN